jgi:signal transduction histidine kinase
LRELVATAIYESPGGQVLVSVLPLGSEMHIAVTDDGRGADQRLRETMARGAEQLIALQGGRIAVEARAQGTTVTVRMPDRVDSHSLGPAREGAQVAEENKHAALAPATA